MASHSKARRAAQHGSDTFSHDQLCERLCETTASISLGACDSPPQHGSAPAAVNAAAPAEQQLEQLAGCSGASRLTPEQREFCERRLQQHHLHSPKPGAGEPLAPARPASPARSAASAESEEEYHDAAGQIELLQQQQQQQQQDQEEAEQQGQDWQEDELERLEQEYISRQQLLQAQRARRPPSPSPAGSGFNSPNTLLAHRPGSARGAGQGAAGVAERQQDCGGGQGGGLPEEGWFKKCRGCGAMTVHELSACSAAIPFCMRCQERIAHLSATGEDAGLWDSLAHVHSAWSAAGL